jgi:uncharacterized protein (DUF433 family)
MNLDQLVEVDPERMGGTPCFRGTRVPIKNLFDYVETGDSLETFLDDFPTVSRDQAQSVLEASRDLNSRRTDVASRKCLCRTE